MSDETNYEAKLQELKKARKHLIVSVIVGIIVFFALFFLIYGIYSINIDTFYKYQTLYCVIVVCIPLISFIAIIFPAIGRNENARYEVEIIKEQEDKKE